MTIEIRSARAEDAPGLYAAWQQLRTHNSKLDSRIIPTPVSEQDFQVAMASILREGSATFVADDNGKLVGFVRGVLEAGQPDRLPEWHATIGNMYVAPSHRRMGVGKMLFEAATQWASKQEGVSHFEMTVLANDGEASNFWRKLGFSPFIERLWAPLSPEDSA